VIQCTAIKGGKLLSYRTFLEINLYRVLEEIKLEINSGRVTEQSFFYTCHTCKPVEGVFHPLSEIPETLFLLSG
jgi:hypothetical protein